MSAISSAIRELSGLFVEDASFTAAIGACLLVAYFVFPALGVDPIWRGTALFGLLALALFENVWRSARR